MLWSLESSRIKMLIYGKTGFYTLTQFARAAVMLLDSKHHAVPEEDLMAQLGRCEAGELADDIVALAVGQHALRGLVEAKMLCLRPMSCE